MRNAKLTFIWVVTYLSSIDFVLQQKRFDSLHGHVRLNETRDDLWQNDKRKAKNVEQSQAHKSRRRVQIVVWIHQNVGHERGSGH